MRTSQGIQISYEWIYNLNPITIIIFILIVARLTAKIEITNSLIIGLILTIVGFGLSGTTREGKILLLGVIIYTFGEMIFNMKILELITKIAPERKKSSYFGILNISYTFGLCI
jgi:dipeptide/tripeptide permease